MVQSLRISPPAAAFNNNLDALLASEKAINSRPDIVNTGKRRLYSDEEEETPRKKKRLPSDSDDSPSTPPKKKKRTKIPKCALLPYYTAYTQ